MIRRLRLNTNPGISKLVFSERQGNDFYPFSSKTAALGFIMLRSLHPVVCCFMRCPIQIVTSIIYRVKKLSHSPCLCVSTSMQPLQACIRSSSMSYQGTPHQQRYNIIIYILLHDREGDMGKYSARGWQYWPERSEGQYRTRELNIFPYRPTHGVQ